MPAAPILFCSHVVEIGGAEMVLLDLLGALDRERWQPHLVVPREGPMTDAVLALDVPTFPLAIGGKSALTKACSVPFAAGRLRKQARHMRARVVVATSMIAGYAGVMAQHRDLACVWHLHIVTKSRLAGFFVRRARAVIVPSRAGAAAVGCKNAHVIGNGVADRYFAARGDGLRQRLQVPDGTPLLGIVGRLDPHKGHLVLLEALARLTNAPQPHLVVAGGALFADGIARIDGFAGILARHIEALGLGRRVHVLGPLADTAPLLAELDAVVVPSTAMESAPRTIAEAQAAGCPVVASAIGGIPEMVADGTSGSLVPPGDVAELANALAAITRNPALRERLRAGGRAAAAAYRNQAFAQRCSDVFAQAMPPA